jgi:hypothetical protein
MRNHADPSIRNDPDPGIRSACLGATTATVSTEDAIQRSGRRSAIRRHTARIARAILDVHPTTV